MNNRWRALERSIYRVADNTTRKAVKEASPNQFLTQIRIAHMLSEKAWTIRTTKGYMGVEGRDKRR